MDKSESSSRFTPPWMLIALVAFGGAAYFKARPPVDSDRPQVEGLSGGVTHSAPAIPAHRWEDPLELSLRDWRERPKERSSAETQRSLASALAGDGGFVLLPVYLDSGPFPESRESRTRTRYAVLAALGSRGYQPAERDACRYVAASVEIQDLEKESRDVVVPYELFRKDDTPSVLVLWLGEGLLGRKLLGATQALLQTLFPRSPEVRLVGPTGSSALRGMLEEAEDLPALLQGWTLYADRATADVAYRPRAKDQRLSAEIEQQIQQKYPEQQQQAVLPGLFPAAAKARKAPIPVKAEKPAPPKLPIRRSIGDDSALAVELMRELKYRHAFPADPDCRTVILSEWDSLYARSWRQTLRVAINRVSGEGGQQRKDEDPLPPNVYLYTYLRGVDGKGTSEKAKEAEGKPSDLPEGYSQIDYIRRIDAQLTALQAEVGRISAIGVMGSDLYDKIILLKALRKAFPQATFFTSDLDARYLHPEERDWAHNLVIASHFGLSLRSELQPSTPPFRDCYQTSTYYAVLQALGFESDEHARYTPQALVFEVGRDVAVPLFAPDEGSLHPPLGRGRHFAGPLLSFGAFLLALLIALFFLLRHTIRVEADPGRYDRAIGRWSVTGAVLLVVLILTIAADSLRPGGGEPFSVVAGISVWPTELVRVLVLVLGMACCQLLIRALHDNRSGLEKEHPELAAADAPVGEVWRRYKHESDGCRRDRRFIVWGLIFFGAAAVILYQDLFPRRPIRGNLTWLLDYGLSALALLLVNFLLFAVADAMLICRRWMAALMSPPMAWPEAARRAEVAGDAALTAAADRLLSLRLIAARSEPLGRLIFYPFLLMSLLVVARTEIFDDWSWNVPLALFFTVMPAFAIAAVLLLRRAAESAREAAINQVRRDRLAAASDPVAKSLAELERQILALREGAFVPLQENPVVASLLIPFSGIGAVEVLKFWL